MVEVIANADGVIALLLLRLLSFFYHCGICCHYVVYCHSVTFNAFVADVVVGGVISCAWYDPSRYFFTVEVAVLSATITVVVAVSLLNLAATAEIVLVVEHDCVINNRFFCECKR